MRNTTGERERDRIALVRAQPVIDDAGKVRYVIKRNALLRCHASGEHSQKVTFMTNHINKEWPCDPEDLQELETLASSMLKTLEEGAELVAEHKKQIAEHEDLLKEAGITGPGSVDKLFDALPELPTEPLPPLRKPAIPPLPDIPTEPLPPLHEQS